MRRILTAVQILLWTAVSISQENPTYEPVNMGYFEGEYRLVYGDLNVRTIDFVDFNEDGTPDLSTSADDHIYLNLGTPCNPEYFLYYYPALDVDCHNSEWRNSYFDINNDGSLDLLLDYNYQDFGSGYSSYNYTVILVNDGSSDFPIWSYYDQLNSGDGSVLSKSTFIHLDSDSLIDIISSSAVYQNLGTPDNPEFVTIDTLVFPEQNWINPVAAADIDNDNDDDLFFIENDSIRFYRNTSDSGKFDYTLETDFYHHIYHENIKDIDFYDYDLDGDFDLFIVSVLDEALYQNVGTPENAEFDLVTDELVNPFPDIVVNSYIPKSLFTLFTPDFADLDSDGDEDLIVSVIHEMWESGGYLQIWENRLTEGNPDWHFLRDSIFFSENLYLDNLSFEDIDQDGRPDLLMVVSNEIHYYRNTTVNDSICFELITTDLVDDNIWNRFSVGFADFDNDGSLECVSKVGDSMALFENTGTIDNPYFTLDEPSYGGLQVGTSGYGFNCKDFDNDGDIDIFTSIHYDDYWGYYWTETWQYYRNDGTINCPFYVAVDIESLINEDLYNAVSVDLNNDGKIDLFKEWTYYQCTSVPRYRSDDPIEYAPDPDSDYEPPDPEEPDPEDPEEPDPEFPSTTALKPVFPNPFNQIAAIPVDVSEDAVISLTVYDLLGRQVAVILDQPCAAGSHCFQWDASAENSGIYFIQLKSPGKSQIRKAVLVK